MDNTLQSIVLDWIPAQSKVVDFGCGDGALLKILTEQKSVNWELRLGILNGKMPSSAQLPAKWYETKNLHLCTIADFEELCSDESFVVKKKVYLNRRGSSSWLANTFPNLFAAQAVYLIG